jgi:hypothetical protein
VERFEITLFTAEGMAEFTDRLGFVLMEMGIRMRVKEFHDDFLTFEFIHAERLEEDGKEKS